jgi:hypothetical protein
MKFCSPGPLIDEHQLNLATFVIEISNHYYEDKPCHLTSYEYDVLYPEAVIFGIRKIENSLSYKKADTKYAQSFKLTKEEITKQKCHEILNRLPKKINLKTRTSDGSADTSNDLIDIDIAALNAKNYLEEREEDKCAKLSYSNHYLDSDILSRMNDILDNIENNMIES